MSDPLSSVSNEALRAQLWKIREKVGTVLSVKSLQGELQGFLSRKGIYKPSGSRYALWVRQTLSKAYPDEAPVVHPDGSWTYKYSPEGRGGKTDLSLDTNKSLLRCRDDGVPVGVLVQREGGTSGRTYEVMGLAIVEDFDGTHFILRGEPIDWDTKPVLETAQPPFEPFERSLPHRSEVFQRLREPRFSWAVNQAYGEKCSLCELGFKLRGEPIGLEAAHVIPFKDGGTSRDVRNGILLCRNHHSLFDGWAWTIDEKYRVMVADDKGFRSTAASNHILSLEGKEIPNLPKAPELRPDPKAIVYRLDRFSKFWG